MSPPPPLPSLRAATAFAYTTTVSSGVWNRWGSHPHPLLMAAQHAPVAPASPNFALVNFLVPGIDQAAPTGNQMPAQPHSRQQCRCTAHKRAIPACLHPAVRRGVRRHEGNLADARTQPNNVKPPQKTAEGSARGQCPGVLYEREGSRGQQDCGRAEKRGGQKQQEEERAEKGIRRKLRAKRISLIYLRVRVE